MLKKVVVPVLMTAGLLMGGSGLIHPELAHATTKQSVQKASAYKTTTDVNFRSGAGTKYKKLLTVPKGQAVKYMAKSGSWYKVSYKGKTGYIMSSYLKKSDDSHKTPPNKKWMSKESAEKILLKEYKKRTDMSYVYYRHDRGIAEVLFYGKTSAKADLILDTMYYRGSLTVDREDVGDENYKGWKKVLKIINKKVTTYATTQIDPKYQDEFLKEVQKFAIKSKLKEKVVKRIGGKDFLFENAGELRFQPK